MHEKTIDEFLEYLKLTGSLSYKRYKSQIKILLNYLDNSSIKPDELTAKNAQEFQGYLLENYKNRSTVLRLITSASRFYDYLKIKSFVISNPFKSIVRIREPKTIPKNVLPEKDISLLLDKLSVYFTENVKLREAVKRYRTHVLCELLYSTGMRIGEASRIELSDVDLLKGIVYITDRKAKEKRFCFLYDYAKEVLSIYINKMRTWTFTERHFKNSNLLFGTKIDSLLVNTNRVLKEVCVKNSLPPLTCHGFRHAFGYHFLRAGCDIRYIQDLLGHKRIESTQRYTKVDKESLKAVIDTFHPRRFHK